jgi:diguanylate cyclase (GGDEF)-like protein
MAVRRQPAEYNGENAAEQHRLVVVAGGRASATHGVGAFLAKQPSWLLMLAGLVLVGLVSLADYLTSPLLMFTPFYLVPVALVTWFVGRRAGLVNAAVSAAVSALVYVLTVPGLAWNTVEPYWNTLSQLGIFLVVNFALSKASEALRHEKDLARTDHVTGAPNSRAFFERVELELERARRFERPITVAYLDADNFKEINDRFGHSTGDLLLRSAVQTVEGNIRSTDLLARLGGDEFILMLPETGRAQAAMVVARVRQALSTAMLRHGWPVTFSIGVVTFLTPPESVDEVVRAADSLMYEVKRGGKNSIRHEIRSNPDIQSRPRPTVRLPLGG